MLPDRSLKYMPYITEMEGKATVFLQCNDHFGPCRIKHGEYTA